MNCKNKSLNKYFTFNLWNKYSIKFFQNLYYNYFTIYKNKTINDNYENVLFPYAGKETYFHMYGKKGFIESQLLVPLNKVDIFLDELEQLINVDEPDIVLFSIKKIIRGKIDYTMSSITGLDGLNPTLKIIKFTKKIAPRIGGLNAMNGIRTRAV